MAKERECDDDDLDWVEIIRAVFAGLKDLALVAVSCYSIYIQAEVRGMQGTLESKVDDVAVKADAAVVKAEESAKVIREKQE